MRIFAVIDTTHHDRDIPAGYLLAGLSLLERSIRLAALNHCTDIIILAKYADKNTIIDDLARCQKKHAANLHYTYVERGELYETLTAVINTIDDPAAMTLWLRSSTIYDRSIIKKCASPPSSIVHEQPLDVISMVAIHDQQTVDCIRLSYRTLIKMVSKLENNPRFTLGELIDGLPDEHYSKHILSTNERQFRISDLNAVKVAENYLWNSCRKDADGIVSRYINRNISISISRRIAHLGISPNTISCITLTLGVLAGIFASVGGFYCFLLAGIVYQINSVIDGVDGELARTKYEFSLLGEWLDTLSDDLSDVFFYIGLTIGAWRTVPIEFFGLDARLWLWTGGMAVIGKLLSMVIYYRWLIANKRGDLLAFQWSFDATDDSQSTSVVDMALKNIKYLFKKDFIVFVAMLMGMVGILPWLLVLLGPGNLIVFISVAIQDITSKTAHA